VIRWASKGDDINNLDSWRRLQNENTPVVGGRNTVTPKGAGGREGRGTHLIALMGDPRASLPEILPAILSGYPRASLPAIQSEDTGSWMIDEV
jgi:hypothetical protein